MQLSTTMILDLLRQQSGRYVHHEMGNYRMKDANGDDVTVKENGKYFLIAPTKDQMDGLMDESRLIRNGSQYRLAS